MELIGRKKFQQIAELTDEEFDLLIDHAYLIPYDIQDDEVFFFENEADFTKSMKDQWIREAKDSEEWAKENQELDELQKKELDDEWASDVLELDFERTLAEEYETRQYGDTDKAITNDEVTEDDLQDIYDILGLDMNQQPEEVKIKKNNEKKKFKKHRQFVSQSSVEESLDPNKGTKIFMDGDDIQKSIERNYGSTNSYSQESSNTSSYQRYDPSYHVRQPNNSHQETQQKMEYDQQYRIFQSLHEQMYQQNQRQYEPSYTQTLQKETPYQSYMAKQEQEAQKNYQSDGHLIQSIDYSRRETYEPEKQNYSHEMNRNEYQPEYQPQSFRHSSSINNETGYHKKYDQTAHYQNQNYNGPNNGLHYPPDTRLEESKLKEMQHRFMQASSDPKYMHLNNNPSNDYLNSIMENKRESFNDRTYQYHNPDSPLPYSSPKYSGQGSDLNGKHQYYNGENSKPYQTAIPSTFDTYTSQSGSDSLSKVLHHQNETQTQNISKRYQSEENGRRINGASSIPHNSRKQQGPDYKAPYSSRFKEHNEGLSRNNYTAPQSSGKSIKNTSFNETFKQQYHNTMYQNDRQPNRNNGNSLNGSYSIPNVLQRGNIHGHSNQGGYNSQISNNPYKARSYYAENRATGITRINGQQVRVNFPKKYPKLADPSPFANNTVNLPSQQIKALSHKKNGQRTHQIQVNGKVVSVSYSSKRPNRDGAKIVRARDIEKSQSSGAKAKNVIAKKYTVQKSTMLKMKKVQQSVNRRRYNNAIRQQQILFETRNSSDHDNWNSRDNRTGNNGNGRNRPNNRTNNRNRRNRSNGTPDNSDKNIIPNGKNEKAYKKIFNRRKHDSRIRMTLGEVVLHGTQIEETDAYQGYRKIQNFGGMLTQKQFSAAVSRRGAIYQIKKLQQDGFTRRRIMQLLKDKKIMNRTLANALENGLELHNIPLLKHSIQNYFMNKYGNMINLDTLSKKQLKNLMSILKNGDQDLLELYNRLKTINGSIARAGRSKQGLKNARRRLRQEILQGLDAYDAVVLFSKSLRGARSAIYIMQWASRTTGKLALAVAKKIAPAPIRNKIILKEAKMQKRAMEKSTKKLAKISKIEGVKAKIKQAPKKAAAMGFQKIVGKSYSNTIVGKVTGKIGDFFGKIADKIDGIKKLYYDLIKDIMVFIGGFLLLIFMMQLVIVASTAITTTIQSLFDTETGQDISEDDVMNSAGGKILTELTEKDKDWVQNEVYDGAKFPKDVAGKKVYGGTDPETGKKIEITEFGSPNDESAGITVNFFNGDAYSAITGKIPPELLHDTKASSNSTTNANSKSSEIKDNSSSSKLKKTGNSLTYKGDEVIFASKGGDNDGIKKTFVSNMRTTGYCSACNGDYKSAITPNGNAVPGFTVAVALSTQTAKGLPYGSVIYVSGHYYVVQDCGPPPNTIDIYVADTLTCASTLEQAVTRDNVPVYIVKGAKCDFEKLNKITLDGKDYTGVHVDDNGTKKWILFDGVVTGVNGGAVSGTSSEIATSNAKAILSMGTVYFDQEGYNDKRLLRAYCLDLWDASHKLKRRLSEIYQCGGCRELKNYKCNDKNVKNAKGPNGKDYGLLDGIKVHKDSYGDEGCKKYYCNEDKESWQKYKYNKNGCKGATNKRGSTKSAELTAAEISAYPKQLKDEDVKNGSGKIDRKEIVEVSAEEKAKADADPTYKAKCTIVETYTESKCPGHYGCDGKHSKKYCPGHVDLEVDACIVGIDENEAVQLFQIDPGDEQEKMDHYDKISKEVNDGKVNWKHWTEANRDMVHVFYDEDWKDLYGIDIESLESQVSGVASNVTSGTLSSADRDKILKELPKNLPEKRRKIIETALDAVGKIPYHWGDKAKYPGLEKNNFGAYSYTDRKGRNKKGLDCSHFVDWVYWTAVGNNLGNGNTETLQSKGKSTNTLKTGDIMVHFGSVNHTGIFIGYTKDNQMIYVHESGSHGNVTVSTGGYFDKSGSVTWRNMDEYVK